jgi:general secretion pathway protein M
MKLPGDLKTRWEALAARERALVAGAAGLVGLAVLWWAAVAPAWNTLRTADAQHQTLDAQLQKMRELQAQAQALQSQPQVRHDDALRALEASVRPLGATAQLGVVGDRATVTLRGASAESLAQWLVQARVNARAVPVEARITRRVSIGPATWDGTVVLNLPPR